MVNVKLIDSKEQNDEQFEKLLFPFLTDLFMISEKNISYDFTKPKFLLLCVTNVLHFKWYKTKNSSQSSNVTRGNQQTFGSFDQKLFFQFQKIHFDKLEKNIQGNSTGQVKNSGHK